jgi:hypothetical protein
LKPDFPLPYKLGERPTGTMSTSNPSPPPADTPSPAHCPSCAAPLPPAAVLCVACGYHLKLQRHLATSVERPTGRPIDPNPFAAPVETHPQEQIARLREPHVADLTPEGARKAKAIVSDASSVYALVLLGLCCWPIWLLLFPWYGFRLLSWYRLNRQFSELRNPYGFSSHGELAASFQDAKSRLWVGFVAGGIYWVISLLALLLRAIDVILEMLLERAQI